MTKDEKWDFSKIQGEIWTLLYGIIGYLFIGLLVFNFHGNQMKSSSWPKGSNKQHWTACFSSLYDPNNCLKSLPLRSHSNAAYTIKTQILPPITAELCGVPHAS